MKASTNITSNRTVAEHTETSPGKERVRRDRTLELQSDRRKPQGVVSISDGLLPTLSCLRHTGLFQGIDHEKAMCDAINNHRPRNDKPEGSYFSGIHILPALNMDVRLATRYICEKGYANKYGMWDYDLTQSVPYLFTKIMPSILQDLADYQARGMIVITACLRADGFGSYNNPYKEREAFIRSLLPRGIEYIKHDPYSSNYHDRHRVFHRRPPMCQFILRGASR